MKVGMRSMKYSKISFFKILEYKSSGCRYSRGVQRQFHITVPIDRLVKFLKNYTRW